MLVPKLRSCTVFFIHLFKYAFCPVIIANSRIAYHFISVDIKLPPSLKPFFVSFAGVIFRIYIRLGDTVSTVCFTAFIGSGAWLVVVVNDIHVLRFTTVAAFASPIVVNIVAHIHSLSIVVVQC